MASTKPKPTTHRTSADSSAAVDELMSTLEHPFKAEIQSIRRLMLGADPTVAEGVKWKAPSFRTTEYFATIHLRAKQGIGIILHLGAKARELPAGGIVINDPSNLLKWLAKDRAMVELESAEDLDRQKSALENIIRQWIVHVC